MDGVARPHHGAQYRRLPLHGDRRLAAGDSQAARRVGSQDLAVEDRDRGSIRRDFYRAFGSFHTGVDERRIDFQVARQAAKEMKRPPRKIDDRGALIFQTGERNNRILIETKNRLVDQGDIRAAFIADLDAISGAISFI